MMTIHGRKIEQNDMNDIASYMDDEIREQLHGVLAPCEPEEFISAYLAKDPDFIDILKSEFRFSED